MFDTIICFLLKFNVYKQNYNFLQFIDIYDIQVVQHYYIFILVTANSFCIAKI